MVTERQGLARRPCHVAALAFVTASALLGLPAGGARAAGDGQPIRLTDAAERGAFNVGAAEGTVSTAPGPAPGGEVLKFDYRMPRGTAAGVWTKGFPEGLDADQRKARVREEKTRILESLQTFFGLQDEKLN